jgi:multiple sugar transport system ATP-binding protein
MAAFLQLRGLSVFYGAQQALRSIDLEVYDNELLVVLGPTGAGKTTLLRALAGLQAIDGGRIEMAGEDIGALSPAARDMGFAFQNFALYPDWSVRRNLEFPLRAPGQVLSESEIGARVAWAAGLLHIEKLLERPAQQLSGGEMQRVAIGRCIVRRPRLFLLDEPLTNLDAKLRETLRVELSLLRRELEIPMVYVTHDQVEALSMADRIAVLADGQIQQVGTPEQVYRQPLSPVVARQLGQPAINLFSVHCRGGFWQTAAGTRLAAAESEEESPHILGVRPEDVAVCGGEEGAVVRVVEDTGATWVLLVDWLGQAVHLIAAKSRRYVPGETIYPRVEAGRFALWRQSESECV